MKKADHFVIRVAPWNTDVHVFLGGARQGWDRVFRSQRVDDGAREHFLARMEECGAGQTMFESSTPWNVFVYFPRPQRPNRAEDHGAVAHEFLHAAFTILRRKGITLCAESEEAFTYLTEYLVREFWALSCGRV